MRTETVFHAPVIAGAKVRRKEPSWQMFGTDADNLLARYGARLAAAGIEDPTEATNLLDQALTLRRASRARAKPDDSDKALVDRVAAGEVSADSLPKHLTKVATPKERDDEARRSRQILADAALSAFRAGCRATREYGEVRWLKLLQPLVRSAVAEGDQKKWHELHQLAAFLRSREVAALSMASCDAAGRTDLPRMYYMFERWDRCYNWIADHAPHTWPLVAPRNGQFVFVTRGITRTRPVPFPTLKDIDPSWGPGLYSAAEAIANAAAIDTRQEREFRSASPTPPSPVRVNV
jgi:hypothetical protein